MAGTSKLPATKSKPAKQPDLQVVSVENSTLFGQRQFERYNPDQLAARKGGIRIYKTMLDDEQVKAVTDFKRAATIGNGWSFEFDEDIDLPAEEKKKRIAVMSSMVRNFRGSFVDAMGSILRGTAFGYSLNEIVLGKFKHNDETYIGVAALLPRDVTTFKFYTDEFGVLEKFVQVTGGKETELDYTRFVHYVRAPEVDPYYGESDLRAAYRPWFLKDTALKMWAQYLERMAGGFLEIRLGKSGITRGTKDYEALQSLLKNVRGTMGALLPDGVEMNLHNPTQTGAYKEAIEFHDLAIAKALLIPNLLGLSNTGTTGAYAQSQTQLEVFFLTLSADVRRLEQVLHTQLFEPIARRNWEDGICPRFRINVTSGERIKWIIETFQKLISANGVIVTEEDEAYFRRLLELPARGEEDTPLVTPQQKQEQALAQNADQRAAKDQQHAQGMDKNRLELDRQAQETAAAAAKAKAQFTREQALDATDIAAIVRDEMMRLAYPQGATMYKGIKSATLFSALKDMKPGDIVTDDKPIELTGDIARAINDSGFEKGTSVAMSVKAKHFMAELPPGTRLRLLSVKEQDDKLIVETEIVE